MNRLLVRVAITVLVVGFWAALLWRGYGGTWGIGDAPIEGLPYMGSVAPDPLSPAPMPAGLEPGDRFDRRDIPVRQRIELALATPEVGSRLHLKLRRGEETKEVTLVAAPVPALRTLDWVVLAAQALYTLLGLVLLWRGRNWLAWGLAVFALGFAMKDVVGYVLPVEARIGAVVALRAVRDIGLYVAARRLASTVLSPREASVSLWAMLGVVLMYAAAMLYSYLGYVLFARHSMLAANLGEYLLTVAPAICVATMAIGYGRSDESARLRIRWILVATLLHAVAFFLWNLTPLWIPVVLTVSATFCFAYAALRSHLVDLSFVISRTLVYGAVVALVVGVFAIVEHAIAAMALGEEAGIVLHLLVPLVLGITLHKLRERIEHVIERLFFRRQFNAERALQRLAHESAYMEREDALIARTFGDIAEHVGPNALAIYRRADGGYECAARAGQHEWPDRIDADDAAFVALRSGAGEQALSAVHSALGGGGIAFPMFVAGRLQGALVCGDRAQQYTPDERQSLKAVAHEVGAALYSMKARESERMLEALAHGKLSLRDVREHVLGIPVDAPAQPSASRDRGDAPESAGV
ncbi:hypothetical protein J2X06_002597 [Lysobacter niastensis]|uniref:GAF domain-containing protein n=1 Tax=Lysobacter niastensis TaxID=380629 RepID=A0ABU1WCP2_9GAMM|nr:GAF domain-containing protein [Lysobacter niastensis]MDR7135388.1 hypothetical protein [Lysobacter niastensis]